MKKALLTLAMAAVIVVMLAAPAFAAIVSLPVPPDWVNGDPQKGWRSNGTDDAETSLTIEQLQSAKYLVLEVSKEPEGGEIKFTVQCDPDWSWDETTLKPADVYKDGKITIELSKMTGWKNIAKATKGKFLIGYWDPNWDGLSITKAYLETGGGGGSDGGGAAKTGDSAMTALSIAALLTAAGAAVFVSRKIKAR